MLGKELDGKGATMLSLGLFSGMNHSALFFGRKMKICFLRKKKMFLLVSMMLRF